MTGLRRARLRMVARLVREGRIRSVRHLWAFLRVPRHRFVPPHLARSAYGADALELVEGQTITCPDFVARMTALADIRPGDRVLEVGAGTGYQAAILEALGARVTAVEIRPAIHALAARNLAGSTVDLRLGDGVVAGRDVAPFDAIVLGCAADPIPPELVAQLAPGGRIVAPEGATDRIQTLVVLRRTPRGLERHEVRAAWFVPLVRSV